MDQSLQGIIMKLKILRTVRRWTNSLHVFLMLLGVTLNLPKVSAQEPPRFDEPVKTTTISDDTGRSNSPQINAGSQRPEVDQALNPSNVAIDDGEQSDQAVARAVRPKALSYILPGAADSHEVTKLFHLQSSDVAAMFEVVETLFQGKVRRISADRRTNTLVVVALPVICEEIEAILLNLDTSPTRQLPAKVNPIRFVLPDSPAAKQMIEQLDAKESAAATEATTIRQLQTNRGAVETIDKHQSQLKAHLQTAFDLKMQLEELQVKELQSRLSRLERQIGHRKALQEKIIARRAAELISGDSMRWNSTTTEERSKGNSLSAAKQGKVPDSMPQVIDKKTERNNTQVQSPVRWRSGIVDISAETESEVTVGSGVLISSSGLILSQLSDPPKNAKFFARLDDDSRLSIDIVEVPGSNLYLFQLPPNTPINHFFNFSDERSTLSDDVYVWGENIGSPEHRLTLFTTQVGMKDRWVEKYGLSVWQLVKPEQYGTPGSWPVLNANGELLGITLRDTAGLLLVLPVERLIEIFPKSLWKIAIRRQ